MNTHSSLNSFRLPSRHLHQPPGISFPYPQPPFSILLLFIFYNTYYYLTIYYTGFWLIHSPMRLWVPRRQACQETGKIANEQDELCLAHGRTSDTICGMDKFRKLENSDKRTYIILTLPSRDHITSKYVRHFSNVNILNIAYVKQYV